MFWMIYETNIDSCILLTSQRFKVFGKQPFKKPVYGSQRSRSNKSVTILTSRSDVSSMTKPKPKHTTVREVID